MNWKRIWTGALAAGGVVCIVEWFVNGVLLKGSWQILQLARFVNSPKPFFPVVILLQSVGIGFVLTWLYVLARPRLGPGPKTAFVTSSIAWFLLWGCYGITQWLWLPFPPRVLWIGLTGGFIECWLGTYLAGWQYIEKAP